MGLRFFFVFCGIFFCFGPLWSQAPGPPRPFGAEADRVGARSPRKQQLLFVLWVAIQAKMDQHRLTGPESPESFKNRLRSTALALPREVVTKALLNMKPRILAIRDAEGKRIAFD